MKKCGKIYSLLFQELKEGVKLSKPRRDLTKFGEVIAIRRKGLSLSRAEVAGRAGFKENYVTYLEMGDRHPSDKAVKAFAEALGIPFPELYLVANPHLNEVFDLVNGRLVVKEALSGGFLELSENQVLRGALFLSMQEVQRASRMLRSEEPGRVYSLSKVLHFILAVRGVFEE